MDIDIYPCLGAHLIQFGEDFLQMNLPKRPGFPLQKSTQCREAADGGGFSVHGNNGALQGRTWAHNGLGGMEAVYQNVDQGILRNRAFR